MLVELNVVEQRYRVVLEVLEDGLPVTEVAMRHGVSRQTVHTWRHRGITAHRRRRPFAILRVCLCDAASRVAAPHPALEERDVIRVLGVDEQRHLVRSERSQSAAIDDLRSCPALRERSTITGQGGRVGTPGDLVAVTSQAREGASVERGRGVQERSELTTSLWL